MYTPFCRRTNIMLAGILFLIGIALAPDFVVPTPGMDVILNMPLAILITELTGMNYSSALISTWLIAGLLLMTAVLIFPYNTKKLVICRTKFAVNYLLHHPLALILMIGSLLFLWFGGAYFYETIYPILKEQAMKVLLDAGLVV